MKIGPIELEGATKVAAVRAALLFTVALSKLDHDIKPTTIHCVTMP